MIILTRFSFAVNHPFPAADSIKHIEGTPNNNCASAISICKTTVQHFNFIPDNIKGICPITSLYYKINVINDTTANFNILMDSSNANYTLYGPITSDKLSNCEMIESYLVKEISDSLISGTSYTLSLNGGYFILKITPKNCNGTIQISSTTPNNYKCYEEKLCSECVTSFSPKAGKYIVSAWVKEANASESTISYTKPSIKIHFDGNSTVAYTITTQGKIIDGWQKMEAFIEIPTTANSIELKFVVSSDTAFFDDVRFFPTDGSMMSYVYDPTSLRLMAELDERNYATLYEYDEEGKLIRIKKETEKGIMTIQENRDNIRKN